MQRVSRRTVRAIDVSSPLACGDDAEANDLGSEAGHLVVEANRVDTRSASTELMLSHRHTHRVMIVRSLESLSIVCERASEWDAYDALAFTLKVQLLVQELWRESRCSIALVSNLSSDSTIMSALNRSSRWRAGR